MDVDVEAMRGSPWHMLCGQVGALGVFCGKKGCEKVFS